MKRNRTLFEHLDIYRMPVSMRFNASNTYATSQGGIFSLATLVLIITLVVLKAQTTNSNIELTDADALNALNQGQVFKITELPIASKLQTLDSQQLLDVFFQLRQSAHDQIQLKLRTTDDFPQSRTES